MNPKDFAKYRMKRPEGQSIDLPEPYGLNVQTHSLDYLLARFSVEDRPTVEEAQRLHDEFNRCFPALRWKIDEIRKEALLKFALPKKRESEES